MRTTNWSRREFLGTAGMLAGAAAVKPVFGSASAAPSSRVAIGMCSDYDRRVTDVLSTMFDQLGGLKKLVAGKTVAIKLNLTGPTNNKLNNMPTEMTHWV